MAIQSCIHYEAYAIQGERAFRDGCRQHNASLPALVAGPEDFGLKFEGELAMQCQHLPVLQMLQSHELLPAQFDLTHTGEKDEDPRGSVSRVPTLFELDQFLLKRPQYMRFKLLFVARRAVACFHRERLSLTGERVSSIELSTQCLELEGR